MILEKLTVIQLIEKCKKKGIKGYSNKSKKDLLLLLKNKKFKGGATITDETIIDPDKSFWGATHFKYLGRGIKFNYPIEQFPYYDSEFAVNRIVKYNEDLYRISSINAEYIDGFLERVIFARLL